MAKKINLAQDGHPEAEVVLPQVTMIQFSQNGVRIMRYSEDGDHRPAENAAAPFMPEAVLTKLQNQQSGYVLCPGENAAIFSASHVKYLIEEECRDPEQAVLSVGLPGMNLPHIMQTPVDAVTKLKETISRFHHLSTVLLEGGHKLRVFPSAIRAAAFHSNGRDVTLDFDTAGSLTIQPTRLGAVYSDTPKSKMGTDFETVRVSACPELAASIAMWKTGDVIAIKHAHGAMVLDKSYIDKKTIETFDYPDSRPGVRFHLKGQYEDKLVTLEFDTAKERDKAVVKLAGNKGGMGGLKLEFSPGRKEEPVIPAEVAEIVKPVQEAEMETVTPRYLPPAQKKSGPSV